MPILPRVESKRRLTTEQPQFLAAKRTGPDILKGAAKVAGQAVDMSFKWANAMSKIQTNTAKANFKTGALDILNRAVNDVDYNAGAKYQKEIEKLRSKSLKGFTFKTAESAAAIDIGYEAEVANIKLDNIFKKKIIDAGQVAAMQLINLEVQNPTANSIANIKDIIDSNIQSGIWSKTEGYNNYKKAIDEVRENTFLRDLRTNPAQAKKLLDSNAYGFDIADKEKAEKLYEKEAQIIRNANESEVIDLWINDELDEDYLKQLRKEGKVDANFTKSMVNTLRKDSKVKPSSFDKVAKLNELIERNAAVVAKENSWFGLGKAPFEDITNLRADILQASADNLITDSEAKKLLEKTSQAFYREPVFREALKTLASQSELYTTAETKAQAKAEMYTALMRKVADGISPRQAVTEVIREKLESELIAATENDSERLYATKGDQTIYSDDGEVWYDLKTNEVIK